VRKQQVAAELIRHDMTNSQFRSRRHRAFVSLPQRFIRTRAEVDSHEKLLKIIHIAYFITKVIGAFNNQAVARIVWTISFCALCARAALNVNRNTAGFGWVGVRCTTTTPESVTVWCSRS
jgi:hypothetical protein